MIRTLGRFVLAITLMTALLVSSSPTAEGRRAGNNHITQGELALMLVNVLGLYRFLPANPSQHEAIEILLVNKIAPANGWEPAADVTRADLARIVVQALGRSDEVENPDNPQSWVDFLVGLGIPIDTVGVALDSVEPIGEPVAPYLLASSASTDPLKKQTVFGQPDEVAFGTDMTYMETMPMTFFVTRPDVVRIIRRVPARPPKKRPVTPDD